MSASVITPTRWDHDSWVNEWQDCPTCGFHQEVRGFDCLACETIANLHDDELAAFSPMKFAASLMKAMMARRAA